uniref:Uncharacterized protein n=1 Tax=Lepeophtheirus salmonis TaxID=72036 RepID=A0A0K2UNA4_LEPSM
MLPFHTENSILFDIDLKLIRTIEMSIQGDFKLLIIITNLNSSVITGSICRFLKYLLN